MKGDFTRVTFDPLKHYSRVLMQQGRVTLDADPNEQTDILLHYVRTLAMDLIGPFAAPALGGGFQLSVDDHQQLVISAGRYYVDGILVENDAPCLYSAQPDRPVGSDDLLIHEAAEQTGKTYWVYLDVWERHITCLDDGWIREKALGGPGTCTRSKVVWQVKAIEFDSGTDQEPNCAAPLAGLHAIGTGLMSARVDPGAQSDEPCVLSPQSKYRGAENHLYRVEVHQDGAGGAATFKWSRDNGSVVAAWLGTSGNDLEVSSGRGFTAGCWVELTDDTRELLEQPGVLVYVTKVEGQTLTIDPSTKPTEDAAAWTETLINPKVRRWDQMDRGDVVLNEGAVPLTESSGDQVNWIDLEDGIQVQFNAGGEYRAGDYWLIPARVATGGIEWPTSDSEVIAVQPLGIKHHYAPLGFVRWSDQQLQIRPPCRCVFFPQSDCARRQRAVAPPRVDTPAPPGPKAEPTGTTRKPAARPRAKPIA
jgi:hypothetical protein